tara:strand:- start:362 stop:583 length:222 start_codon:yes stop_codon:yes gene_type:complete
MSLTIIATILKILAMAKEGVLLTNEIAKVVDGLEGESGKPIVHMTDDELLEVLSKNTRTPEELLQEGRDQVSE